MFKEQGILIIYTININFIPEKHAPAQFQDHGI